MDKSEILQSLKDNIIPEFVVSSLGDYCDVIDYISEAWREKIAERQTSENSCADFYCGELSPWFRGVSKISHEPESLLFRFYKKGIDKKFLGVKNLEIEQIESYLLQRFKTFASPFLTKIPIEDIEWHFLMRHHNIPSRLLDWSKGSFIGLYFATRKSLDALDPLNSSSSCISSDDSTVWMLEPRRLSEMYDGKRNIYGSTKEEHIKVIEKFFPKKTDDDSNPEDRRQVLYPLPIIPDLVAPRIEAHIGRFTLHPFSDVNKSFNESSLYSFAAQTHNSDKISYLVKIIIPNKNHFSIARSLRSTGISDMNFSQDLDGLSKELSLRVNIGREDHNRYVKKIRPDEV